MSVAWWVLVRVSKTRDGVEYAYIVEAYRDEQGRSRQRVSERHGRLDKLLAADPDALAKLKARAKEMTAQRQARRGTITFDTAERSDWRWRVERRLVAGRSGTGPARRRTRHPGGCRARRRGDSDVVGGVAGGVAVLEEGRRGTRRPTPRRPDQCGLDQGVPGVGPDRHPRAGVAADGLSRAGPGQGRARDGRLRRDELLLPHRSQRPRPGGEDRSAWASVPAAGPFQGEPARSDHPVGPVLRCRGDPGLVPALRRQRARHLDAAERAGRVQDSVRV